MKKWKYLSYYRTIIAKNIYDIKFLFYLRLIHINLIIDAAITHLEFSLSQNILVIANIKLTFLKINFRVWACNINNKNFTKLGRFHYTIIELSKN